MKKNYKQSQLLNGEQGIRHGFFTKSGGVSSGIYNSLNCGPSSDDELDNVLENRKRALTSLGIPNARLYGLKQIHSTTVYTVDSSTKVDFREGDGLVTRDKQIALSVLGADCAPLLFSDDKTGVIGAAHAGWKGAVSGMVEAMVVAMCQLGANRDYIKACIGPTIHQQSYEVKQDFIDQLQRLSDLPTDQFLLEEKGNYYFDLPAFLLHQFKRSEIQGENLALDTYPVENDCFSFRRNTHQGIKEYGRQISIISLLE